MTEDAAGVLKPVTTKPSYPQTFDPNDETTPLTVQIDIFYASQWSTGARMQMTGKQLNILMRAMQNPSVRCILMDQPSKRVMVNVDQVERFEITLKDPEFHHVNEENDLRHATDNMPKKEPWQVRWRHNGGAERLNFYNATSREEVKEWVLKTFVDSVGWRRELTVFDSVEKVLS